MESNLTTYEAHHRFHIPVMGTGFSIDTPLRVAKYGIASVISLVDDLLIEKVRKHYAEKYALPYEPVTRHMDDARARRITAYLDLIADILERQLAEVKAQSFEPGTDKTRYFELLPESSPLKRMYRRMRESEHGDVRDALAEALTSAIRLGRVGCNIMTKLDRAAYDKHGAPLPDTYSDAKAALRGFANSKLEGDLILSAGVNPTLFGYLEEFRGFYRDERGHLAKRIILKVTDFRSSLIQGKLLGKKGLEVAEIRIESGLNCGGHAFASDGLLLGPILEEFKARRSELEAALAPLVSAYYAQKGWPYALSETPRAIAITAQGGLGTPGENLRMLDGYGLDAVGWASPFLLVPEATPVDDDTRAMLAAATEADYFASDASPLGVAFNNVRGTSAQAWTQAHIAQGKPGSPCPKGHLRINTEFGSVGLCTASREYQAHKLKEFGYETPPGPETDDPRVRALYAKECICDQLGNAALMELGIKGEKTLPVSICPGPNLAYFDRTYSLDEMVDFIYGRRASLVPSTRPHVFAKELTLYVDHFLLLLTRARSGDAKLKKQANDFHANLLEGIAYCDAVAEGRRFGDENLDSLRTTAQTERARVEHAWAAYQSALAATATAA